MLSGAPAAVRALSHPPSAVCPVLTFSNGRGACLAGEFFRALLSFRNQSPRPLAKLFVRVELISPQAQRSVLWDKEIAQMEGRSNREVRVEQRILEPGKYTLSAHVAYVDTMTNEAKRLTWSSNFEVSRGIVEVQRKLTIIPQHPQRITQLHSALPQMDMMQDCDNPHLEATAASVMALHQHGVLPRLLLSVTLQNTLVGMPLMLTNVRLVLKDGSSFQLVSSAAAASAAQLLYPQTLREGSTLPTQFAHQYSGGGRDALEDGHISPGDTRNFVFELVHVLKPSSSSSSGASSTPVVVAPTAAAASGPPSLAGSSISFFSSGASGVTLLSKSLELGHMEWEWRRTSGDGGIDMGSIIRLNHQQHGRGPGAPAAALASKLPELELMCLCCLPQACAAAAPKQQESLITAPELTNSPPVVAGTPCNLTLVAINRSSSRRDLALHIHPRKVSPQVLYTGPTVRPLGWIEPNADAVFSVTVVPITGGVWSLAGLLELRDARNPSSILWPVKSSAHSGGSAPPPLQASGAAGALGGGGGSGGLSAPPLNVPAEPWPPKLCEILVL